MMLDDLDRIVDAGPSPPLAVLLVEDEITDAVLIRRALRDTGKGLALHHLATLGEALAWLAENRCDVVLLDLSLPDSLGFATIHRMRETHPSVPLVVLTGHDDPDFALAAMEAGTQDYLVKGTTDGPALLRSIRYAIARTHLEQRLRRSEQRLNGILTLARDAILVVDAQGMVVMFNPAAERMFGCTAAEILGHPLGRLLPERLRDAHHGTLDAYVRGALALQALPSHVEAVALARDGREFPVEISLSPSSDLGDGILTTAIVRDVTDRKRLEEELRRLAATDPLTGLPNRRSFLAAADGELDRVRRYGRPAALLMLDIDRFKRINDSLGHAAGDEALRHLAEAARIALRSTDVIGRLGGEEFGILLPETGFSAAMDAAERLRRAVAATDVPGPDAATFRMTVSIGVSPCMAEDPSVDYPLARADRALLRAKESGRNRVDMEPAAVGV